jgi:hypothetical protein
MIDHIYTVLKNKIQNPHWREDNTTPYIFVDWYLGQDMQNGEEPLTIPTGIYIQMLPTIWKTLLNGVQRGELQFKTILLSETVYGDEKDILSLDINHVATLRDVFKSLMNERYGYTLPDDQEAVLFESIVRTGTAYHNRINNIVRSEHLFKCVAYDYTALDAVAQIIEDIDLETELLLCPDPRLEIEVPIDPGP